MSKTRILVLLLLISCDLFSTREPEEPQIGNGAVYIQPDRPEIVVQNLVSAIRSLTPQNYLLSINQSDFEFQPSSSGQQNYPGFWESWGYVEEQTYITNLVGEAGNFTGHSLQLSEERYQVISVTEQQYIARYSLTIVHNRPSIPTVATGEIVLTLKAGENGLWAIYRWTDLAQSSEFTWSEFKAVFVRG